MNPLDRIAEQRIAEAIEAGLLENLPGRGKPLELEDLSRVPEDLRGGYLLLKGANVLPEEMALKKEILTLGDLLRACTGEDEARGLREEREALLLRFHVLMERRA